MSEPKALKISLAENNNQAGPSTADIAGTDEIPVQESQQITMTYKDESPGLFNKFNPVTDKSFYDNYKVSTELDNFMKRPVLIHEQQWEDNSDLAAVIFPWALYFQNPVIKRKLDNYSLLSCNLKLKIVINASPFYYGLGVMAYRPMASYFPGELQGLNNPEALPIGLSQRPCVWFYPQCNQGGEMTLPFIYNKDWLRVTDVGELQDMGTINLLSYTALKNANDIAGTGCTIQILAYAEDVRVCGPTYLTAAQAGDEYAEDEVISKPASAISKAAGLLTDLPIIGPFMTATSNIASKVGGAAAWLGFTNVPVIDDVKPFKDLPFHSFASSEIGQPIDKLTMDPKNELTVDPRVVGADGQDAMEIKHISMRKSYLTQFPWESGDPPNTWIFGMNVTPDLHSAVSFPTNQYAVQSVPMAHISRLFKYWTGDIVVSIKFICSRYHRGRALVVWDPIGIDYLQNPTDYIPSNYTRLVDIAEEPEVEIRIPYLQATAWLENRFDVTRTDFSATITNLDLPSTIYNNGSLGVAVYTTQTSPVASAEIRCIVSVRGAENLRFAAPADPPVNYSQFTPQSGDVVPFGMVEEKNLSGENTEDDPNVDLVYMGETILSLRQLLRRTSFYRCVAFPSSAADAKIATLSSLNGRIPYMYGYDPLGIQTALSIQGGNASRFNWCRLTPFTYVMGMYVGNRGSMNWHFNVDSNQSVKSLIAQRVNSQRNNANDAAVGVQENAFSQLEVARNMSLVQQNNAASGISVLNQETQTGLSVQAPMYSRFRMLSNNPFGLVEGSIDEAGTDSLFFQCSIHPKSESVVADTYVNMYSSIGTDFSFLYFLNVPTFFLYSTVPSVV